MSNGRGRRRSFRDKLSWLLTLTAGGAIVAVCVTLALLDYFNVRRETVAALQANSLIVAMNSGAPLAFADIEAAQEALGAFRSAGLVEATLFDLSGHPFARHVPTGAAAPGLPAQPFGSTELGRWQLLVLPIEDRGQPLGRLQVVYGLDHARARLWRNLLLAALVTAVAVLLVHLVSRRLSRVLMRPIDTLGRTAQRVAATRDYALRAEKLGDDELGEFTDTFNAMLMQIQRQDRELHAARSDAEAASQLKDEFLATLSHELRTPLTPILGWAQILHRIGGDDPRLRQAAEVIERSARSQAQIVDDLLDMSRIISGKLRLELQPFDLDGLIEGALDTVRTAADARGVRLLDQRGRGGQVVGDPHRLQQVLWNLLSNAIKFSQRGGEVEVAIRRDAEQVEIDVRDTGQGIATDFLPHVFERFRQADSSITRNHGGLGLGLAIARQLVELHGGSLQAASAGLGHGTTFTVRLPARPPVAGTPAAPRRGRTPTPLPPGRSDTLQVLLLAADPALAAHLADELAGCGITIEAVAGSAALLPRLAAGRPDLLLVDLALAGAAELIRDVRQLPPEAGGAVAAIALGTGDDAGEPARALLAGFQAHVPRPVQTGDLLVAIASLGRRLDTPPPPR